MTRLRKEMRDHVNDSEMSSTFTYFTKTATVSYNILTPCKCRCTIECGMRMGPKTSNSFAGVGVNERVGRGRREGKESE